MGGIILVASLIIWMLSYFPRPTEEQEATARTEMIQDGNTNVTPENVTKVATTENSCLARLGKLVQPVFEPLGFNWKMTVSLISGTVAKETVVSTLGVLYSGDSENEAALAERIQKPNPKTGVPDFTPLVAACFMILCSSTCHASPQSQPLCAKQEAGATERSPLSTTHLWHG